MVPPLPTRQMLGQFRGGSFQPFVSGLGGHLLSPPADFLFSPTMVESDYGIFFGNADGDGCASLDTSTQCSGPACWGRYPLQSRGP